MSGSDPFKIYSVADIYAELQGEQMPEKHETKSFPPFDYSVVNTSPLKDAKETVAAELWPPCIDLLALDRSLPVPPNFIIPPWLPVGYLSLFAGHGGSGKSLIALMLAVCVALGLQFFGLPTSQRRVLYVSCEDRADVLHWRLKHICDFLGVRIAALAGRLDLLDLVGHQSVLYERGPLTGAALTVAYSQLAERALELSTELLILDGISDTFGGNENSKTEVKQFVNSLIGLIPPTRGAVLLIGHVAKPAASMPNTSEGYSGTTGWHNSPRARWYLYPETEPNDAGSSGRLARTGKLLLELQKSNYGATSDQAMEFRWDEKAHLFIGRVMRAPNPAQLATQEQQEKQGILDALRDVARKGINVPASKAGPNTGYHVLRANPHLPASLKRGPQGRRQFWRLVDEMLDAQVVRAESYRGTGRHEHTRLVVT